MAAGRAQIHSGATNAEVLAESLQDPAFRAEWDRTAVARAVALRLVAYRADHDLTQRELARRLGIKQPQVNRLESGDVNPSIATLTRIAERLGIEIAVDIRPSAEPNRLLDPHAASTEHLATYEAGRSIITVAAT